MEDFDRLVIAHPNSSALWVQYMAFFLHTAEVEKARAVAKRALATISFRCVMMSPTCFERMEGGRVRITSAVLEGVGSAVITI